MYRTQFFLLTILLTLSGCQTTSRYQIQKDTDPDTHPNLDHIQPLTPQTEPLSRRGNINYQVNDIRYQVDITENQFEEEGIASWYGKKFHGHETSNGEIYDMFKLSAAHKTLPLPSYIKVTNKNNQKTIIVRVNDRGPFHEGRVVDLSYAAARKLGVYETGTAPVKIELIQPQQNKHIDRTYQDLYIQIAASQQKHALIELATKLNTIIDKKYRIIRQGNIHKLQFGPYKEASTAHLAQNQIKSIGYPQCFVTYDMMPKNSAYK